MTKWHINGNGEVGRCTATKGKCPFGGASGLENHYSSREEAEKIVASSMADFSSLGTASKKRQTESFQNTKTALRKALVSYGVSKSADLPDVATTNELVERWFDGDKRKFEAFKSLVNNQTLTPVSKKSIAQLINRGVSVDHTDDVNTLDSGKATVDLLDESLRGVSLADIRGRRPF